MWGCGVAPAHSYRYVHLLLRHSLPNCFRAWKFLKSSSKCAEALATKIKVDKFDMKGSLNNMRKHNADVKAMLKNAETIKESVLRECATVNVRSLSVDREGPRLTKGLACV